MSKDWYNKYYQDEYRVKSIHSDSGIGFDFTNLFKKGKNHGVELGKFFERVIGKTGGLWMEIGSSAGGVLAGFKEALGVDILGVEPSRDEAEYAKTQRIPTIISLVEDLDTAKENIPPLSGILCTQSLNHFLDPKFFFTWMHEHLREDGFLILEVMNFEHQLERAGHFRNAVQIDHVYMFTPRSVESYVREAGFDIIFFEVDREKKAQVSTLPGRHPLPAAHIRVIAKKSSRSPFATQIPCQAPSFPELLRVNPLYVYLRYIFVYRIPSLFK